jgi:gliding motility-associated-like protein
MMYFVRAVNKRQTMTASSNRSWYFSGQVAGPQFVYIKTASVIKKNVVEVQIYLDNRKFSRGMIVQRSEDGVDFQEMTYIPFTGVSTYTFQDEKTSTEHKYYYYRTLVKDSCGNLRLQSNTARTILLKTSADNENVFLRHLSWSPYYGFDAGVKNYVIYRAVNDVNSFDEVGTTDSTTFEFTDNIEFAAPLGARVEYVVKANEGDGNRYGVWESSFSNYQPAYMEAKIFIPNAFAPSGKNKTWKPVTHFVDQREYHVTVYNRWGHPVYEGGRQSDAWDGEGCPADIYAYIINYKNSRGEYMEEKGHVTLLR